MPAKTEPRTGAARDLFTLDLDAATRAALDRLAERMAGRMGGNPDRLRAQVVRELILTADRASNDC